MDNLAEFILRSAGERWALGHSDCCPWVLRWVADQVGQGLPVPDYDSDRQALLMIREAGSLTLLLQPYCEALGLAETIFPDRGDIATIGEMAALSGQTIGICMGEGRYAVRVRHNCLARSIITTATAIKAWRVGC